MHSKRDRLVAKRVMFYRVYLDGRAVDSQATGFDVREMLRRLDHLPYDDDGRYEADDDDSVITCFIDGPLCFRFGRIRRSNLPPVADGARVSPIQIGAEAGLFECCHVVYLGRGVLGAEFNHYAPRVSGRLGPYVRSKRGVNENVEILPIARTNPAESFRRFEKVHSIQIKVSTAEASRLRRAGAGVIAQLAQQAAEQHVETLALTMSGARGRQGGLSGEITDAVARILRMPDIRESIEQLKASGYVPGRRSLDVIDLLEDDLIVSKQFVREGRRTKSLSAEDAYRKIAEAYDEIRDQLG